VRVHAGEALVPGLRGSRATAAADTWSGSHRVGAVSGGNMYSAFTTALWHALIGYFVKFNKQLHRLGPKRVATPLMLLCRKSSLRTSACQGGPGGVQEQQQ
jgi:hypothetical protein